MSAILHNTETLQRSNSNWSLNKKKSKNVLPKPSDFQPPTNNTQSTEDLITNDKQKSISFFRMFRYSTICERLFMLLATCFASVAAIGVPYGIVIYGEFTALLIDRTVTIGTSSPTFILNLFGGGRRLTNATKQENLDAVREDATAFGLASLAGAIGQFVCLAIAVHILNICALKQIGRIRKNFLEAILRQDMSWYDKSGGNNFASKMTEELDKVKEGISEKVVIFTYLIMTFVFGIIASFLYGWKLTLLVLVACPFIIISTAMVARIQASLAEKELKAYANAGAVAEEVISSIRTVFAFSGERKEMERFSKLLVPADKTGRKKGLYSGIGGGAMWFIIYCAYAIAIWYGVKLILDERDMPDRTYTPAVLVVVLFGIIMGAQNLGFSTPHIESFATASGAASNIFSIIDRKSQIDALDQRGEKPDSVEGNISFENIFFRYPARSDVQILGGFSLNIKAGQTVAFVGPSGCGKSTTMQLMQRFYDPLSGTVKLDGRDLRDLNVGWLRSQIGVVGQEPVLFATTIEENIRYGNPSATMRDIETCARTANCHEFIMKLPKGYQTMVGERGAQMSGGQKQRIAIARALLRNPKILLLDEATSALDPTSERRVQDALEVASKGRTTLVVSHRLSTVTNADLIVFVKEGVVAESGTHEQLMNQKGLYYQLVMINNQKERLAEHNTPVVSKSQPEQVGSSDEDTDEIDDDETVTKDDIARQKKKSTKKVKREKYKISTRKLWELNAPEWRYILIGCIAAVCQGATFPVWSIMFGDFFGILSSADPEYIMNRAVFFAYFFIGIGIVSGLSTLFQNHMLNTAGVKMTTRLRERAFNTIISQEVAYFYDEKNSVGALCARLSSDCSNVQGATGSRIGIIVQAVSTLLFGMIAAFVFSWELALIAAITVPFVCGSIVFEARFTENSAMAEKTAVERASQVAVEAIGNIRTVASLGQETDVLQRYSDQLEMVDKACTQKIRFRGPVFGLGQVAPLMAYGVAMYYGGLMVADERIAYQNVIKVSEALIFSSWMLGQAMAYSPNMSSAILSAGRLLKLFERVPVITSAQEKPYNTTQKMDGDIFYDNVDFHYPNRKEIPILQQFSLHIKSGTTVALVGPSGSGKSTCIQLLLRYYDPVKGTVNLSDVPTTDFSLDTLRSKMGLVSQEPTLFDRTIAENIAYGNNFRDDIPITEIIEVAKKANIHDFIVSLPQGYDTRLGSKGAQLSGGQKQRIAIARALVRNPKILLLDEATSALDMESEKIVQNALDVARSGRTCITIAHRLTTIQDADMIFVLKRGVIVERGTHEELMAQKGIYTELYTMQQVS